MRLKWMNYRKSGVFHRFEARHLEWGRSFLMVACFVFLLLAGLPVSADPYGLDTRPLVGPFLNQKFPSSAPTFSTNWSAVVAFPNLHFTNALGITFIPGTTKLCVWEREGRVWSFDNFSAASQKTKVLDVSNQCQGWDDSGLLGLAFHPGFATNRYMFVYYTWVPPGTVIGNATTRPPTYRSDYRDRLSRFTLDASGVAIPGSELVLVDQGTGAVWHNGGGMFFHPVDGFLYYTDGDDTSDPNGQIINRSLLAGVFRIDVDQRGGNISHPIPRQPVNGTTAHYYIPNDNPFVGQPGVLEEFFCLGLRSPHRMTYDPPSGRIFIGDVGAAQREEIDVIEPGEKGLNFQWPNKEGLEGDLTFPYDGINRRPILDYGHNEGAAVIGGYVYRGNEFASELGGRYIFGDNVAGTIWVLDETTSPAGKIPLCVLPKGPGPSSGPDYTGLSSFGLDQNGEIYMCQLSSVGGRIYKLAHTGPPPSNEELPQLLSQTGAFVDLQNLIPVPGLLPYDVNSPLWSDGAMKQRWMALPTNTTINFSSTGEWVFPAGTVFVKHFELGIDEANPNSRKRLETRFIVRDANGGIYGASYKWRADNSDADLVINAVSEDITIQTTTGPRTQQWYYPGRQDCVSCHTPAAGGVLGVKTRQLNRLFDYPQTGQADNQLRAWNHVGLFNPAISESAIAGYAKLVDVNDTGATLESRVRSYLDANCSHCHRPGGVQALFDARYDTPLGSQGLIDGTIINSLGIVGAKVVSPGSTNKSILFHRAGSLNNIKMPPLAKNVIDTNAISTIAQWINQLPGPTNSTPSKNFAEAIIASGPVAYWRLNEANGATVAVDALGNRDGVIGNRVTPGVAGPRGADFAGFESNNVAMRFSESTSNSYLTMPALNLEGNSATIACWFYSFGYQSDFSALVFSRSAGTIAGLHFGPWSSRNELRFTWDDDHWGWSSGLSAPSNQWCFTALVIQPNSGTIYLGTNQQLRSVTRNAGMASQSFTGPLAIGWDPHDVDRIFHGMIDEVAVYNRALGADEVQQLFDAAVLAPLRLTIGRMGADVVVKWPRGTLQSADTLLGPWVDLVGTNSPYVVSPAVGQKFYRVKGP